MGQHLRLVISSTPIPDLQFQQLPQVYIFDQEKCEVCLRTRFQFEKPGRLHPCSSCRLAWWCSSECQKDFSKSHSKRQCDELQKTVSVDRLEVDYAIHRRSHRHLHVRTERPRTTYLPLSSISDREDYFRRIFPGFSSETKSVAGTINTYHPDPVSAVRLVATEATCFPLTVIAALEDVVPDLSVRSSLCIHVVGAGPRELYSKGILEELLHFFPMLKRLKIFFVGPETPDETADKNTNVACQYCIAKGHMRTFIYHSSPYHDFAFTADASNNRPDLIVALNTGMSEVETESWKRTIGVIRDLDVPGVFTAYTKLEAESEIRMLKGMGVRIKKGLALNKWKGVVPTTNNYLNVDEDGPIASYNSYYRYIIQGRA
ncbi:hypothetical protein V5O48_018151 [Marasmius crinis-equi]|uniref:Mitochondrial splicing suppressor 51-like C-terminal domain-containing protein n=1 Tax=Marasmius crinis-equi TaxID=585013 RepID=A0ABR3EM38_9AGAR